MLIIECDLHSSYQVIAMLNSETGELVTRRLRRGNGKGRAFYTSLPAAAQFACICHVSVERKCLPVQGGR